MRYLKIRKGWIRQREIISLHQELTRSGINFQLLYVGENAIQVYQLVFIVAEENVSDFETIVTVVLTKKFEIEDITVSKEDN